MLKHPGVEFIPHYLYFVSLVFNCNCSITKGSLNLPFKTSLRCKNDNKLNFRQFHPSLCLPVNLYLGQSSFLCTIHLTHITYSSQVLQYSFKSQQLFGQLEETRQVSNS